jgi:hypothetical protein
MAMMVLRGESCSSPRLYYLPQNSKISQMDIFKQNMPFIRFDLQS